MNAPLSPAILLEAVRLEKVRRLAEASLYEFVKAAWHVVDPHVPFIESWHIRVICEHLEAVSRGEIRRLLINIPPRHSKSTIVSVMWPMWEWIARPSEKYLCASYSGVLSIRDNLKSRRLIQSVWYQRLWGDRFSLAGDQNAKQRFENDKTGYRLATSVGGTATGEGGSRLVLDDPHGAQDAQSEALRETALEWFDMVWSTRLNDPKRDAMVTIMQRLHDRDVSGHILEEIGGWEHICIPAEWDGEHRRTCLGEYDPRKDEGELICSERFGQAQITELKQQLGEYGAAGQLQQDPTPRDGGILKASRFRRWDERLPVFDFILQSYDTAFTEKNTGDPSACTAWGVFQHEKRAHVMLLDAWDERLSYPSLRKRVIEEWGAEYGNKIDYSKTAKPRKADRILIEAKASGQSLIQDLRMAKIPVETYDPGRADKIARAHQAAPILETDIIWIPGSTKNPGQFVSWAATFLSQVRKFPVAEHDDLVDTFTQAMIYLRDAQLLSLAAYSDPDDIEYWEPKRKRANPYAA